MNVKFSKDVLVLNKFLLTDPIFSLISQTLFCKRVGLIYLNMKQYGNFTSFLSLRFYVNFWDSRDAKSATSTHLEAMNFDFFLILLHLLKAEIYTNVQIQSP